VRQSRPSRGLQEPTGDEGTYARTPIVLRTPRLAPIASGQRSSPGRSEGIGGGQYTAGMTYGLFGKFSARPGRHDDLITYLLKAAKLPQRVYEIAGPR